MLRDIKMGNKPEKKNQVKSLQHGSLRYFLNYAIKA